MVRLECSVDEFNELTKGREDADLQHQLGYARGELSAVRNEKYDLEEQVRQLRLDLYQAQKTPPIANAEQIARDLIEAATADQKINCIKIIRAMTGYGLKESKDLFEAAYAKGQALKSKPLFGQVG